MLKKTQMSLKRYIKNKEVNHFSFLGIEIFIKDKITNNISAKEVLKKVSQIIPSFMLQGIDSIYIGQFDFLINREVQAMYENSSIFITNLQDSAEDMLDDIIHEVAHGVEDLRGDFIYSDGKIEKEFLYKRKKLWTILDKKGLNVDLDDFLNVDFSYEFDDFLYREIGYPLLSSMTSGMFFSPYAATSLKEYFANGFEAFFLEEDTNRLKVISPVLFDKISSLVTQNGDL